MPHVTRYPRLRGEPEIGLQWQLYCLYVCAHHIQVKMKLRVEITNINYPLYTEFW